MIILRIAMDTLNKFREIFLQRKQLHNDFKYVFGTEEGKRVLAYICKIGYVNVTTFNPLSPEKTLFNEGSRQLALTILKHTHIDPKEIVTTTLEESNYNQ